jgi:pyoverdine/dityrosine biosynthesis protein Dit1
MTDDDALIARKPLMSIDDDPSHEVTDWMIEAADALREMQARIAALTAEKAKQFELAQVFGRQRDEFHEAMIRETSRADIAEAENESLRLMMVEVGEKLIEKGSAKDVN